MCENFVTHTLTHMDTHVHARGYKMKLYFVAGKEGGEGGWKKGSKKCHENGERERNVLFFNVASWRPWKRDARTLVLLLLLLLLPQLAPAADHHHHQRWASFPCLCPSLSPCDSSMSFPFHHCHNFVSQSLLSPHISHVHMIRGEKALLLCNFCAKNGPISMARSCNLPTFLCHLCGKLLSWLSTSFQLLTDSTALVATEAA